MNKVYVVKCERGYIKFNCKLGDYNENAYFEGFSEKPETFFSSEYRANLEAKLCGLEQYEVISR
ncbi:MULTISPECIES: hypothetical protein [Metabacillus]|uniref:hypothetical protein n=1 Tax=Metabacillus TaxID=2675233 RepID=UPI000C802964|nr:MULTISPECIES: hypothetical protein [Metabacillus]MCM3443553.1 hypothetical protein [Metabacillus halosaccharovorans]PMC35019.1 hypothetical protein CJ195_21175 [Bacillus sp. UMB0899]